MSHHDADPEVVNAGTHYEDGWEKRDLEEAFWPLIKYTAHFIFWSTLVIVLVIPIQNAMTGNRIAQVQLGQFHNDIPVKLPRDKNAPLIQSGFAAHDDIHELRRHEAEVMNNAGWVDKSKGVARMPIEDAIEKVAAEGLPKAKPRGGAAPQ